MTIQALYDRFCIFVLERGGLQLSLMSQAEFINLYVNVAQDFLRNTGIIQRIYIATAELGQPKTTLPEWVVEPLHVFIDERYLHRSSLDDAEELRPAWMSDLSGPRMWRNDKMSMLDLELMPAPNRNGTSIDPVDVTASATEIDAAELYPKVFYATITGDSPSGVWRLLYGDQAGPLRGSRTNVTVIATANIVNEAPTLGLDIELIPDVFSHYILFGILEAVFNQDGEFKDVNRANYCASRYREGMNLANAIMSDEFGDAE